MPSPLAGSAGASDGIAGRVAGSACGASNTQFPRPDSSISNAMTGSRRIRRLTAISPDRIGSSPTSTSSWPSVTMFGRLAPAALLKDTSDNSTATDGNTDKATGPSIARSRPVSAFASVTILSRIASSGTKNGMAMITATMITSTAAIPMRTFFMVLAALPGWFETGAQAPGGMI